MPAEDQLIAVSGSDEQGRTADQVFSPATGRWSNLPDDPLGPSFDREMVWLGDRLLLTAHHLVDNPGADGPSLTRLAVLDGSLKHWTTLPDSEIIGGNPQWVAERVVFPATGTADGGEVGNWGRDYSYGAIWDPATQAWSQLPSAPKRRSRLAGAVGSVTDTTLVDGHLLNPRTAAWTEIPPGGWGDRTDQTILTSPDTIFVWGGLIDTKNTNEGFIYRP